MGEGLVVETQLCQQVGYAGWEEKHREVALGSTLGSKPGSEPLLQHLPPSSSPFSLPPSAAGKFPTSPGDVSRPWGCSSRKHRGPPRLLLPPCSLLLLEVRLLFLLSVVCWSAGMAEQQQRLPGMKWGQGKGQGSCRP